MWYFSAPREIVFGEDSLSHLNYIEGKRAFIVSDPVLKQLGIVARIEGLLHDAGFETCTFAEVEPEPSLQTVKRGAKEAQAFEPDWIVALGGGSPMDTAKAVAVLARHGGPMRRYKAPHLQDEAGLPVIAIPTTAGTGSEATRFTIVTDESSDEKMLCIGLAYLPVAALVDYELTLTKPKRLTADTGIDALTHAIEAYVSRRSNLFSDGLALQAMRLIAPNLRRVWTDPGDRAAREAMMLGATQAGIAFSNSSVALVHGMSRPIGAHFHVAHGLSNAMLLPAVTAYSASGAIDRYATCARAMGVAKAGTGDEAAVEALVAELRALNDDLDVPSPQEYGLDAARWEALIPTMAQQALASGSPGNNPRVPGAEEIAVLYREVWAG